jgi:lipopolysaccharide/colanic/teichoic acid biosynthesis glycosyltransferase
VSSVWLLRGGKPPDRPVEPASQPRDRTNSVRGRSVPEAGGRTGSVLSRLLDILLAAAALILSAPLMALIAAVVRATSPGPVLFRQTRVGYLERPFQMLKFRTMYVHSDDTVHRQYVTGMLRAEDPRQHGAAAVFKLENDARVTPIGGFLRRTSLDELPQLVNVLRRDMSLVGPRPAMPWEVALYKPHHRERFQVKPGITGLWQVRGRSKLPWTQALELDVEYVRRRSLALDIWILLMTLPAVLRTGETR